MKCLSMIDYLTVIYKNYDLLYLQLDNFEKRFSKEPYNLIVIDNTPDDEKKEINVDDIACQFYTKPSRPEFDGISHGSAIDYGLQFCTSSIIGIIDSDFFILNNNIQKYIFDKFEQGYRAVGTEYNDGKDTRYWVDKHPEKFRDIPCCFGSYYDIELARSQSWIITQQEVDSNRSTGFVEVGYKIRKHILENKIKTLSWKTEANEYGNCFFKNEKNVTMGLHYVAGSHRRWNESSRLAIEKIIEGVYV